MTLENKTGLRTTGQPRRQLALALMADPVLGAVLRRMPLEASAAGATTQTVDQSGSANAKAAVVKGHRNVTKIRHYGANAPSPVLRLSR